MSEDTAEREDGHEQLDQVVVLDLDSSPEQWKSAFEQYYSANFAPWQLQARVKPGEAETAYRSLLERLTAHENELALLYRTGAHGRLFDEGYFGTSSGAVEIEDLIFFQIREPKLTMVDLSGFDRSDNNRPHGYPSVRGITLSQPLAAYALRTTAANDWNTYLPETPTSNRPFHAVEPVDGIITLSYIDQYFDHRYPAQHRGLEYALADQFKFPSISVTPTRFDRHMRLFVGSEAVVQEIERQSWFAQTTKDQVAGFIDQQSRP